MDHRQRRVERHWRDAAGQWRHAEVTEEGSVLVPCPETTLTLAGIYEGVEPLEVREEPGEPLDAEAADGS